MVKCTDYKPFKAGYEEVWLKIVLVLNWANLVVLK